jgi:predicted amidohydrolase
MRLAALAWPVEPTRSVAAFAEKLDRLLAEAPATDLALMPEYACVELGTALAGTPAPDAAQELTALVAHAEPILASMREAARRHRLWLAPGTLPMEDRGRIVNRAPLITPEGRVAFQEKRIMTRFEKEDWGVSAGAPPQVFDTDWGRIGIAICYDAEFPKLARAQVEAGAWLVLIPSCTDTAQGAERVRLGARARAMENQCFTAVAPTVGLLPGSAALDANHGIAGIYGPVDRGFPEDGVLLEGEPDRPGWITARLDPAELSRVREAGAVRHHRDWPRAPLPPCAVARYA